MAAKKIDGFVYTEDAIPSFIRNGAITFFQRLEQHSEQPATIVIHDGPPERVYTESEVEADRKELLSLVQVLVDKGNAVVERWDSPLWKDVPHTGTFINDLRTAVEAVAKYGITPTPK